MADKKRVALCLSGQMRSLEHAFEGWIKPNIFDCNPGWQIDTFAHTWFAQKDIDTQYELAGGRGPGCSNILDNVVYKLFKLYNPQKALVEQQVDFVKLYAVLKASSKFSQHYCNLSTNILKQDTLQEVINKNQIKNENN